VLIIQNLIRAGLSASPETLRWSSAWLAGGGLKPAEARSKLEACPTFLAEWLLADKSCVFRTVTGRSGTLILRI